MLGPFFLGYFLSFLGTCGSFADLTMTFFAAFLSEAADVVPSFSFATFIDFRAKERLFFLLSSSWLTPDARPIRLHKPFATFINACCAAMTCGGGQTKVLPGSTPDSWKCPQRSPAVLHTLTCLSPSVLTKAGGEVVGTKDMMCPSCACHEVAIFKASGAGAGIVCFEANAGGLVISPVGEDGILRWVPELPVLKRIDGRALALEDGDNESFSSRSTVRRGRSS
mmetsp:Transcript_27155/g.43545  ORF Transcript_27155/g.43545 Transcript_27155/m.43545 type:complete len:224 (-) Transcript_27155:577-1248(-)